MGCKCMLMRPIGSEALRNKRTVTTTTTTATTATTATAAAAATTEKYPIRFAKPGKCHAMN